MKNLSSKARSPFQRALFATNCSANYEGALQAAFNFCEANKASLRILHVSKTQTTARGEIIESIDQAAALIVRQMKERAIGLGLNCSTRL